jgi:hypothetical protein
VAQWTHRGLYERCPASGVAVSVMDFSETSSLHDYKVKDNRGVKVALTPYDLVSGGQTGNVCQVLAVVREVRDTAASTTSVSGSRSTAGRHFVDDTRSRSTRDYEEEKR